jgi:hypothetical protein
MTRDGTDVGDTGWYGNGAPARQNGRRAARPSPSRAGYSAVT